MSVHDPRNSRFLFWIGFLGVLSQAIAPFVAKDLKYPELLPVYLAFMGIGRLTKPNNKKGDE